MSEDTDRLDGIIDDALRDLAAGAPRDGFRGRVIARITALPEPSRVRFIEVLGWRVRPLQLAAAGFAAACVLVMALVVPSLLQRRGPSPAETTIAGSPRAAAPHAPTAAPVSPPGAAVQVQAASFPAHVGSRRAAVQRAENTTQTPAADEESSGLSRVNVSPLPDPDPIINSAIQITPVEIPELEIPEIQVRPLDAGRSQRDNNERQ